MSTPVDAEMSWTLEVVAVPVSDVDRAKAFYRDQLGFHVDHDVVIDDNTRLVQLTPPGSSCSIVIGTGAVVPAMAPGSVKGLQLVVPDITQAHRRAGRPGRRREPDPDAGREPNTDTASTRQRRLRLL